MMRLVQLVLRVCNFDPGGNTQTCPTLFLNGGSQPALSRIHSPGPVTRIIILQYVPTFEFSFTPALISDSLVNKILQQFSGADDFRLFFTPTIIFQV